MAETADRIACPNCGKQFRWNDDYAQRKVRCTCGQLMRMPADATGRAVLVKDVGDKGLAGGRSGGSGDSSSKASSGHSSAAPPPRRAGDRRPAAYDSSSAEGAGDSGGAGGYDLNLNDQGQAVVSAGGAVAHCASCNSEVSPGAVICMTCGFNLREGKRLETTIGEATDEPLQPGPPAKLGGGLADMTISRLDRGAEMEQDIARRHRFTDLYLPVGLLALGVVFTVLQEYKFHNPTVAYSWVVGAEVSIVLQIIVMVPLLLLAIILTARLLDASYGAMHTGLLKLAAIAMGPLALADFLSAFIVSVTLGMGIYVTGALYIVICAPFVALMFDLDFGDAAITVVAMIMVRMFVILIVWDAVLGILFG